MSEDANIVSMVGRKKSGGGGRHGPLSVLNASDLEGREVPKRDWLIPSILLRRSVTLFGGDGGTGKSLLCQQMQVATALGKDWLGFPIATPIVSLGIYCEDDEDELHRRFVDICAHYGCNFSDLDGRVLYVARVDDDNEMVVFNGRGENPKPVTTSFYDQIEEMIDLHGVRLTCLDTVSDVYGGNENNRYQVKRFVTRLRRLTKTHNGGVILNAHPSKASMTDGSYFSGTTAWHGAVRTRIYLGRPKKTDDEDPDDHSGNERLLRVMKSNYSPAGEKVKCHWKNGAFALDSVGSSTYDRLDAKRRLLDAARYLVANGSFITSEPMSRSGLVALARKMPSCKTIPFELLIDTQKGLLEEGQLINVEVKRDSKWVARIRPSTGSSYPIERPIAAPKQPETTLL